MLSPSDPFDNLILLAIYRIFGLQIHQLTLKKTICHQIFRFRSSMFVLCFSKSANTEPSDASETFRASSWLKIQGFRARTSMNYLKKNTVIKLKSLICLFALDPCYVYARGPVAAGVNANEILQYTGGVVNMPNGPKFIMLNFYLILCVF